MTFVILVNHTAEMHILMYTSTLNFFLKYYKATRIYQEIMERYIHFNTCGILTNHKKSNAFNITISFVSYVGS